MPTAIGSDRERVSATISFWKSRFGKGPSAGEIQRTTGLSFDRVADALAALASPTDSVMESLRCQGCAQTFTRQRVRGRKPLYCPECR